MKSPLNLILGAANVGDTKIDSMARFDTPDEVEAFVISFTARGYRQIDTARAYSPHAPQTSEPRLGAIEAGKRFIIDTKVNSITPGSHSRENIAASICDSLAALRVSQVNIQYLHHPDRAVPFEETCEAMDEAYRQGRFKQFGLSNYSANEVAQIIEICKRRGFVLPTVYQGHYNTIVRGAERELFPLLRENGIAFYAFSPAAGGFFAGSYKNPTSGGRYDRSHAVGGAYGAMYGKDSIEAAADHAVKIASEHGIDGHGAGLRWTIYHSALQAAFGDSVIIGASSPGQLTSNMDSIEEGPLPQDLAEAMSALYEKTAGNEIPYHM